MTSMDHPALSVIKNDTTCVLTLTQLVGDWDDGVMYYYEASSNLDLTASYAGSALLFGPASVYGLDYVDVNFYVNAKLSAVNYSSNFVLSIIVSSDGRSGTGSRSATYATVGGSVSSSEVTPPFYTLDLNTDALALEVDVANVVTAVSGKADLVDGATTGDGYVIDLGTLPASPTFADVDAAYLAGTPVPIVGANPKINASEFGLVGVDLTTSKVRTIIIQRAVSGVASYQTFKITFNKP